MKFSVLFLFFLCFTFSVQAQEVRTELFVGNEAPVLDVFWIKPFHKDSPFMFLSRNKLSVEKYEFDTQGKDQFSSLNVLGYQFKKTGLGVVIAATATSNSPTQFRTGLQFMKAKPTFTIYSILSTKLGKDGDARWLTIGQYTPEINKKWRYFFRGEWVTSIVYQDTHRFSQGVLRLGFEYTSFQFGLGSEWLFLGQNFDLQSENYGIFLTKKF